MTGDLFGNVPGTHALAPKTYGKLHLTKEGRWSLSDLPPHVIIRLKQLFPRIPKTAGGPYEFPADLVHAADLAWFISRYPVTITPADLERLNSGRAGYEERQSDLGSILLPDFQPPVYAGIRDGYEVRRYQAQAVEILARSQGLLLGDEVGLGKTFTTAAACLLPDALPAVVVCQPHLQKQWAEVIERFTTLRVHVIRGTRPYKLPAADVYLFRYTQIAGWIDVLVKLNVGLVAYDEVQELRTGVGTAKGHAAWRLSAEARMRLGLTATPIYNYGVEIFNVMQSISPGVLGSWEDFAREWAPSGKVITDPRALGTYLLEQHAFLRRTKKDVGQEVPPVNRIVDTIDYDEATVHSIDALAHQLAIRATTGTFEERGNAVRELDLRVRQTTGVAKAKHVAQFARILVEGGEPIVLVGWHRDVYDIWLKELSDLRPAMYTGSETATQKEANKRRFLTGETDVLVMSLRSGAGLDGLQFRCSTMVFGELDWSPGVHHQCVGRLDREGQPDPVTAIFLVVDEGSDPPVMEILGIKASQSSQIIDPSLGVQMVHTDVSKMKGLVDRYLRKRAA